jgi:predicted AAA+ superfamily ATPase
VADTSPSGYFDLESARARLTHIEEALGRLADRQVILDEVQRLPALFQPLRGLIDRNRRQGRRTGQFLLLGSASLDLLRQSGETLAGRIAILELGPLDIIDVGNRQMDALWLRGGFPDSFLAPDADESLRWRRDFIPTYLERDVPQFGPRIPADPHRRQLPSSKQPRQSKRVAAIGLDSIASLFGDQGRRNNQALMAQLFGQPVQAVARSGRTHTHLRGR